MLTTRTHRRRGRILVLLSLIFTLLVGSVVAVGAQSASATPCYTCESGVFGAVQLEAGDWLNGNGGGVTVYSNGDIGTVSGDYSSPAVGMKWQCVELTQRLYQSKGWHNGYWSGVASAYQIYDNATANGLVAHPNNGTYAPVPGDMIVHNPDMNNPAGHVSIVDVVSGNTLFAVEQNVAAVAETSAGRATYAVATSGILSRSGLTQSIRGIVHSPSNTYTNTSGGTAGAGNYQPFAADFNGDAIADIGLRDSTSGIFFMRHGTGFSDQISYPWAAGANYQPFAGDFNSDGLADIGLRDSASGIFFIKHGPGFGDQISYAWAAGTNYQPFVADFNGDGMADIGVRDTSNGIFFIKHGPSFGDQISYQWAAGTNYRPFAADFNGDGVADIGLRDSGNGVFYIKHGLNFGDQISYAWASGTNYQPYAADFNGDGVADIGMRDVSNGTFFIKHGTGFGDQVSYQWAAG